MHCTIVLFLFFFFFFFQAEDGIRDYKVTGVQTCALPIYLPAGALTTNLLGSRVTYTMTPLMFTSALIQYNTSTNRVSANVRLRWEYRPGSELFVVYNEERDTLSPHFPDLQNRAVIVKINRLFRF